MQTITKPIIEPPRSCAVVAAIRRNCQADGIGATHFAVFVLSATENKSVSASRYPNATKGKYMPLHVKREDVPERKGVRTGAEGEGSMVSVKGYGNECSLMIASRAPGYHTTPHIHESEQLNYIQEGEIWFFVEEQGFHCKKGDFQRIPGNKVHWAWNRSDKDAVVIEAHAPGLVGLKAANGAVALFDTSETPQIRQPGINEFVSFDASAVESKYSKKS